jgi:hypothetical protein
MTGEQAGVKIPSAKSRPINLDQSGEVPGLAERRKAALENYENLRAFYQGETIKYSRYYISLQVVTLLGSALTPVLLLVKSIAPVIQAIPSALAGLAAALNASLHYRQYWADNYYTLSALMNEYDRFSVRASPDYSGSEEAAVNAFQNRMSLITMSEVASWRQSIKSATVEKPDSGE